MNIDIGELPDGALVFACDEWLPHCAKKVEYYEEQRLINLVFDVLPERSYVCNCEVGNGTDYKIRNVEQILIIENALSESARGYYVPLEVVSDGKEIQGRVYARVHVDGEEGAYSIPDSVRVGASGNPYDEIRVLVQMDRTAPVPVEEAVLRRDDWKCRFCAFRSKKYQMTVRTGGDRRLLEAMNAACPFCAQVAEPAIIPRRKSGVLVWLPELSQIEVNDCARAVYVTRIGRDDAAETAKRLLAGAVQRREAVPKNCGISYDPAELADELESGSRKNGWKLLEPYFAVGLRIWPLDRWIIREGGLEFNKFPQMLAYWRSPDGSLSREDAAGIVTTYAERVPDLLSDQ